MYAIRDETRNKPHMVIYLQTPHKKNQWRTRMREKMRLQSDGYIINVLAHTWLTHIHIYTRYSRHFHISLSPFILVRLFYITGNSILRRAEIIKSSGEKMRDHSARILWSLRSIRRSHRRSLRGLRRRILVNHLYHSMLRYNSLDCWYQRFLKQMLNTACVDRFPFGHRFHSHRTLLCYTTLCASLSHNVVRRTKA